VPAHHSLRDLLAQLEEGILGLTSSERWRRHLDVQSRFHRYSYANALLIVAQRHDATRVAGFVTWRRLGRTVRKGEKAIWILAPMVVQDDTDAEKDRGVRGFRTVAVFDVAQTDGEELPGVCTTLAGDDPAGSYERLAALAASIGFRVEDRVFTDGTNGDCSFSHRRIRVASDNAPAQRVKTLAHEVAHAMLHEKYESRALAELEAESTAYVVCQVLGIDAADYSFGYVASWAGGGAAAVAGIKGCCGRIQQAAAAILAPFDVPDLGMERCATR
jgi:antirestriction protein ArdC